MYLFLEFIHGHDDEIAHHPVLDLCVNAVLLDDGPVERLHLVHDVLLDVLEGGGLVVEVAGHLVGLQVDGVLVDVRLDAFVVLADHPQHQVGLLVDEVGDLLLCELGLPQQLGVLGDV